MQNGRFLDEYKRLNARQKEAVDTIEGPVMVIAGPGTGKTQVISLRIGNILQKTDTQADGILCLTFTNSGVEAMRKRLFDYIGPDAGRVNISTFHAFGGKLAEEFYHVLGLPRPPELLGTEDAVALVDHILETREWKHIRPRGNGAQYFKDLTGLVSLLIRERLSPDDFQKEIDADIRRLEDDPDNISSRGPSKGKLKKEVENRVESLKKTAEVVEFYKLYEEEKLVRNAVDYDGVLSNMVRIVSESEDARDTLRERYLYVLVDEHQDSSNVQNEFLKAVWGDVEHPNVFAVGDDRQLIYGFSGASLSQFEEFKLTFPGTKVITLTDNYRSTQRILDAADELLKSTLAEGKLLSQNKHDHPIELVECAYPRDEILSAGLFFKKRIEDGVSADDCALLLPKNAHVRSAAAILLDMGLPVSASGSEKLFEAPEFRSFLHILRIIADPFSQIDVAESVLDPVSGIPALRAHEFLHSANSRKLSVQTLLSEGEASGLLSGVDPVYQWGKRLEALIELSKGKSVYELVQEIGKSIFLDAAPDHGTFVRRVEIVRSLLHLAVSLDEKGEHPMTGSGQGNSIRAYLDFIGRMIEYGENVPLAIFGAERGVRVMTLHGSKGLEFDAVWIAHMNERALMSGKKQGFSLPESVRRRIEEKDEAAARREVYVALTRAKRFAVLSYATMSHKGAEERLAAVLEALPREMFSFVPANDSEKALLAGGADGYVSSRRVEVPAVSKKGLEELVRESYPAKKVSVTLLNNFYECPWKWYFRSFLEVPEPLSESLEFGSVVHSAIEELVRLERKPAAKDIVAAIEHAIEDCHISDVSRIARMTRDAEKAVKAFVQDFLPDAYPRRDSERALSTKDASVPKLTISGKIDLVEYFGKDSARVTDFKTGKTRKASEIERLSDEDRLSPYLRQLAMYSYLLNSVSKGNTKVEASRLYFIEDNDPAKALYETRITKDHIDLLLKDIQDYEALMESGEWTSRPCDFTPRPGEPDCPYCKKAEMYR